MLYLERELRKTGDPKDEELANSIAGILKGRRRDIHLPPDTEALLKEPDFRASALRTDTIDEYLSQIHTSELVTKTWKNLWVLWGLGIGQEFSVPPCPINDEAIRTLEEGGYIPIYVPKELSESDDIDTLITIFKLKIFDGFFDSFGRGRKIELHHPVDTQLRQSGWLSVERAQHIYGSSITWGVPDNQKLIRLEDSIKDKDRIGQTLNTYIIASEFSDLFFKEPFDLNSTSDTIVLFGSTYRAQPLFVSQDYDKSISLRDNLHSVRDPRTAKQLEP